MAATTFFGSRSVDWIFGSLEVTTTFLLFRLFPWLFFLKLFSSFSRKFNRLFLLQALGGSEAHASLVGGLTQLTAALMRCDKLWKLSKLKRGLYFFLDFLALSKLIGYIDLTDYYEIWPKCSLVINAKCALTCRRSANIQFTSFKLDFLVYQSEYRKSLTLFCSLSATDWHCAACLVVLESRKAGNSVKQIVAVCIWRRTYY